MRYTAGLAGMMRVVGQSGLGNPGLLSRDPHWYCDCGKWSFLAHPMSRRKTGNNHIEALRGYRAHVDSAGLLNRG